MARRDVSQGDLNRFEIDVSHVNIFVPVKERWSVNANIVNENLSGASPWFTQRGRDGEIDVVMSGATIEEQRQDYNVDVVYYGESFSPSFGLGTSTENDYQSIYISHGGELEFNRSDSSFFYSISYSDDTLEPTQPENVPAVEDRRIAEADKETASLYFGVSQVFSKKTIFQVNLGLTQNRGFLSDPYKQVSIFLNRDRRPDERIMMTASFGMRHYISEWKTAAHTDLRYFYDDWEVESLTFEYSLFKELPANFLWKVGGRFYAQTQASFYEPYEAPSNQDEPYFSSDYRLSPFGAISFETMIKKRFSSGYGISLAFERYTASGDYSLDNVTLESPALVDYTLMTFGFDREF